MRRGLQLAERLYAALLVLYPAWFRAAYGQPMRLAFRDACQAAYRRGGAGGLCALWLPTLLDLFVSALEERARQGGLMMSKSRLAALSGPLTIVVGALWLLSAFGAFAYQTGLAQNEAYLGLAIFPVIFSVVPHLFAALGTRLRFHASAGALGRLGLGLSVAGCAGWLVSVLVLLLLGLTAASATPGLAWLGYAPLVSFLSIRVGYLLFGVEALRTRPLPRWNALPLLVGASVVLSLPFEWFGAPALVPVPGVTPFVHFALTGAGWMLLGLALLHRGRQPEPAAA